MRICSKFQIFDLAKKIKGIILRPAKQCLRPELCQLASDSRVGKNEDFSERLKPISKGGLFTRFQIARTSTTAGHRGAQGLHRMDTTQPTSDSLNDSECGYHQGVQQLLCPARLLPHLNGLDAFGTNPSQIGRRWFADRRCRSEGSRRVLERYRSAPSGRCTSVPDYDAYPTLIHVGPSHNVLRFSAAAKLFAPPLQTIPGKVPAMA